MRILTTACPASAATALPGPADRIGRDDRDYGTRRGRLARIAHSVGGA
jgi:hypothetical protein